MTPIEIFEYKRKWMSAGDNHPVLIHSDYRTYAKEWCKNNLKRTAWSYTEYTDVYEDTFHFESKEDSERFLYYIKRISGS